MARTPSTESTPRRKRWNRWINRILLLLFVGLLVAPGIWGYRAQSRLDALLAEYRSRGEPAALADLRGLIVPDEQNGVIELRAAAKLIDEHDKDLDALDELALPLTDEEMRLITQVVERYRPAIDGVRRAAQKSAFDWQVQWQSPTADMVFSALKGQKSLAHVLHAAALRSHQAGNEQEALAYVQDVLLLNRGLEGHGGLIPQLTSSGIGMMGVDTLTMIAPTLRIAESPGPSALSQAQVRKLIAALLDDPAVVRSSRRGLIDERVCTLDLFQSILAGHAEIRKGGQDRGSSAWSPFIRYFAKGLLLDDAQIVMRHLTAVSHGMDEPNWPAYRQRVPERPAEVTQHPRLHLMASTWTSGHSLLAQRHYHIIAERRMAAIALAIRWWSLEHDGRLPASLDELAPRYLPAVPPDPFSANGVILYKPDPDRPILYSVGHNGTDDGGLVTHPNRGIWEQPDAVVHLKQQPRPEPEPE